MRLIHPKGQQVIRKSLWDTLWIAGPGICLWLALRWIAPINTVPSASMEPTIKAGSRVLVNRLYYRGEVNPERGDVVVFDSGFRMDREPVMFTKRVVAIPGDRVAIISGELLVNNRAIAEDYATVSNDDFAEVTIPEGHYFLMGDNRNNSYDSRFLGVISRSQIEGRVSRLLSFDKSFFASPNQSDG
ncbi:MAG: signal peptidase I [Leptolyngbya sp. SIOISBB]|nr:signal peptidase I [Leptolyngbya sp. SIOISBB]